MQSHIHNLLLIIRVAPTTPYLLELAFIFSYCKEDREVQSLIFPLFLHWACSKNQTKVVGLGPNSSGIYVSPEAVTLNIVLSQGTYLLLPCHLLSKSVTFSTHIASLLSLSVTSPLLFLHFVFWLFPLCVSSCYWLKSISFSLCLLSGSLRLHRRVTFRSL